MGKLAQAFVKYLIHAKLSANGVIEKPDVIGAIFGQTEGLLGTDLDLRELQKTGRIGRIEVKIKTNNGVSEGDIVIPSSLNASETSLIAASLETIDKIGPCDAEIKVKIVEDVRGRKRQYVIERAKEILKDMIDDVPDSQKISESIKEAIRSWEISEYHGLSCGPDIENEDEIIIVEGRADVINLLKNGIRNVIAIEGSNIPQPIIELTKRKVTTAFIDGDRGGELDLKKLLDVADIDYVARAEEGKEVEELTKKEIYKALREKKPVNKIKKPIKKSISFKKGSLRKERISPREAKMYLQKLDDLLGTHAAYLLDRNMRIISKIPLSELSEMIENFRDINTIIFDGKINQMIVDLALQRKINRLVARDYKESVKSGRLSILTQKDLKAKINMKQTK